ncbi:TetR/AcrR family transcriptional regulator [Pseudoduganella aquatica]|uniref:TetR family transcriptional regulator n=1 Tax=Pseudoduganella aquatica TaxID=2660641 RepID=A0A7X4H6P5_9BURK|nr:TetR/AcrR family transcriptional regulator [Pseudoduganella aquatica]MYN05729.1 TetR family transcriptional regulator [Pseudoduganella aquatica]
MKKETAPATPPVRVRGRPLSFDRDAALEKAMLLFWRHGYESTSISDLTQAMGITPPSLYSAFGDKERLFLEAVERYAAGPGNAEAVFAQGQSARSTVEQLLKSNAIELTRAGQPPGCMVIASAVNGSPAAAKVQELLRGRRAEVEAGIGRWIARGIDAGELPADTGAAALARFYYTVIEGMTLQARDGAGRKKLLEVVALAMGAWPAPARV